MITVNVYSFRFKAVCPADGQLIEYEAEIASKAMIRVEAINAVVEGIKSGFHEKIADELWERFGGQQAIRAVHQGVEITTTRTATRRKRSKGDEECAAFGEARH